MKRKGRGCAPPTERKHSAAHSVAARHRGRLARVCVKRKGRGCGASGERKHSAAHSVAARHRGRLARACVKLIGMHLTAEDVENLLDLDALIADMRDALIALSAGKVVQPVRSVLTTTEPPGWFALMPAIHGEVMGAKLVTVFPQNAGTALHTHQAVILLFSAKTGEPLATLDGRVITAWRTAAVSALATQTLAPPDARVLSILGSGVQARTHLAALRRVHEFSEVRVWSRNPEHAQLFAEETGAKVLPLEDAVREADVICTVTHSGEAFVRGEWLKQRVHINAVGAVGLVHRELDDAVMHGAGIVVEERAAAGKESAEIVLSGSVIYAELGELLAHTKTRPANAKTIYKSLGVAIEDISAARMIWRKKRRPFRDRPIEHQSRRRNLTAICAEERKGRGRAYIETARKRSDLENAIQG